MLRLFLTKMLVTMSRHFWQQTQKYITKTSGKNIAIKVLILGWQKWQNLAFLMKYAFFDRTNNDIFGSKFLSSLNIFCSERESVPEKFATRLHHTRFRNYYQIILVVF